MEHWAAARRNIVYLSDTEDIDIANAGSRASPFFGFSDASCALCPDVRSPTGDSIFLLAS